MLESPIEARLLPRIIWVAAHPPIPPFSGYNGKTLCGLDALSTMTEIDLITFADESSSEKIMEELRKYWQGRPILVHILSRQKAISWQEALWQRRFQKSTTFDRGSLAEKLSELGWSLPNRLVIFDDIVLTPIAVDYGSNSILSPHDCMSQMFLSHYRLKKSSVDRLRKYIQYRIAHYYEKTFYHCVLLVHVITQRDRTWLERINPYARYHVVPNSDLLNPGFSSDDAPPWDILIWGDLTVAACAQGTHEFLVHARRNKQLFTAKKILIGKVSKEEAVQKLGKDLMAHVEYAPRLEDESGRIRSAKIMVIPDIGGAGIKNRVVNVVSSGLCLACLIPQMEGVEAITDRGAINAVSMAELVERISWSLVNNQYWQIAKLSQDIYTNYYNIKSNRRLWREMIERAIFVRKTY